MNKSGSIAFYARVSSDAQARAHTIDSQVAALKERIAADGLQLEPDHGYVDDGWSGTNLQRPALEKLRDAVAGGEIECIYVHAPDRLARRHAHQVLFDRGVSPQRRRDRVPEPGDQPYSGGRALAAGSRHHCRIRADQDSGACAARASACGSLWLGQRIDQCAVWVSLYQL